MSYLWKEIHQKAYKTKELLMTKHQLSVHKEHFSEFQVPYNFEFHS